MLWCWNWPGSNGKFHVYGPAIVKPNGNLPPVTESLSSKADTGITASPLDIGEMTYLTTASLAFPSAKLTYIFLVSVSAWTITCSSFRMIRGTPMTFPVFYIALYYNITTTLTPDRSLSHVDHKLIPSYVFQLNIGELENRLCPVYRQSCTSILS